MIKIAAVFLLALCLAGCDVETKEQQEDRINSSLPSGCSIKSLGRYGRIDEVVVVTCDGRPAKSVNYQEEHSSGKNRTTYRWVVFQLD